METKLNIIDKCKQEVEFVMSAEELIPYFEKAYLKYRNKINVSGFRKGKAPITIVKKLYGDAIEHGSLENIASEVFNKYLKDNNINIIGGGVITDINYSHDANLKFKIKYEVIAEFELKNYKGLEVTKPIYEVDEKMVDDEIKYLQAKHAAYEIAEKAESDDYVITVSMQKLDKDNFPLIGYKTDNVKIYLNDINLDRELKDQLVNIHLNESKIIKLKNPEKASHEPGENYSVTVNKIEKIVYPELTPDFFGKMSKDNASDLDKFKNFIKKDLENIYSRVTEQELENNIVSEIIRTNDIPAPDSLVEKILDSKINDIKSKNPKRELPADFDIEEYKKNHRVDSILQVKWYLVREKIIDNEKLEVTPEEKENLLKEYSDKYNLPIDKIRNLYEKNQDFENSLLDKKLMEFLKSNSIIKEIKQTREENSKIYA